MSSLQNYLIYSVIDINDNVLLIDYSPGKLKSVKDSNRRKFKDLNFKDIKILKSIDNVSENEILIEYLILKYSLNYELKNDLLNDYNNLINLINSKYPETNTKKYKITTLKKYLMTVEFNNSILETVNDFDKIMVMANTKSNKSSRVSFLKDMKVICRELDELNNELIKKIENEFNEQKEELKKENFKQLPRNDYKYDDLIKLYNSDNLNHYEKLWLSCNLLIPPRRNEWMYAQFILYGEFYLLEEADEIDDSINYVIIHDSFIELCFNNYKTCKTYGEYRKILLNEHYPYYNDVKNKTLINPSELSEILIESYKSHHRKYLFGYDLTDYNNYYQFTNGFLKDDYNLTQTDFRVLFITHIVNELGLSADKRVNIMSDMAHKGFELQEEFYIKKNTIINEEVINTVNSIEDKVLLAFNEKINAKEEVINKMIEEVNKLKIVRDSYRLLCVELEIGYR